MIRRIVNISYRGFSSYNTDLKLTNDLLKSANLTNNFNFIEGKRLKGSGEELTNFNPATGQKLCSFNSLDAEELNDCISTAAEAQQKWVKFSTKEKADVMTKAANIIRSRLNQIATIDVLDTGKPYYEAEADILACSDTLELFGDFISSIEGSHVSLPNHSFYYTRREPIGVCAGIGAWNFPFQMISWKSAPALAAGNSLVFKPSPLTPLTAVLLAEIYHEAGVPEGLISVVQGDVKLGRMLTAHPEISKLSFTGSVPVGKQIMGASSDTLKHLTLELGGKSPLIVFEDADIDEAIKGVMLANFLTQGQVCSNGTRVFIQAGIYDEFVKKLAAAVTALKVGDPFVEGVAVGAIISKAQHTNIMRYIEVGNAEGAKLVCGGEHVKFGDESGLAGGWFISPCLFDECTDDMRIVKEEIFGPVASLLKFESEDEVIRRANDSPFGLAGGLFTTHLSRAHRVANQLECGSVYINNYNAYPPGIPFGGYKESGFGRENCFQTLQHYTQLKSVYVEGGKIDYPFYKH